MKKAPRRKGYSQGTGPDGVIDPDKIAEAKKILALAGEGGGAEASGLSTSSMGSLYGLAGELGSAAVNKMGTQTGKDESVLATNMGSKALERAGQGAAIGSMVPVIGTAIGAGVGAVAGGIEGYFDGKNQIKKNNSINQIKNQALAVSNSGKGIYADGGPIVGPGTGKSDSIDMSLVEGSFVVPAENAHLAIELRKKYLS